MAKDAGALQHLLLKQWKSPFSDATVTFKILQMLLITQSRGIESTHLQQFTTNAPANSPHLSLIQAAFTLSTMTVQKERKKGTRTQHRAEATSAPGRESVQRRMMVRMETRIKQNNVDNKGIHVLV